MSDRPTSRVFASNPLRVMIESAPGSREFIPDPRCAVRELTLSMDDQISTASIEVFCGPLHGSAGTEENLRPFAALDQAAARPGFDVYLGPDQEMVIYRESDDPGEEDDDGAGVRREFLFSGYCDLFEARETGAGAGSAIEMTFRVESMLKRLNDFAAAQILGRRMRNPVAAAAIEPGDDTPTGTVTDTRVVPGLACLFSTEGKGNRAKAPITISVGEDEYLVHVFTSDKDPDAEKWTAAQVLRYLLFFHVFSTQAGDAIDDLGPLVGDGNILELTEDLVTLLTGMQPATPVSREQADRYALLSTIAALNCDGLTVVEALLAVCDQAGLHLWCKTENRERDGEPTGEPYNRLYVRARGAGPIRTFSRWGQFADLGRDAAELLAENDVGQLVVRKDYSDVVARPIIHGDVRRYEVTVELVPGWEPDANLDDVATGVDDDHDQIDDGVEPKLSDAEIHLEITDPDLMADDAWFQKYHLRGSNHHAHRMVGRRWVLNETGRYTADAYARTTGPFQAAAYEPWRPSDADITDNFIDDTGTEDDRAVGENDWVLRPRPFAECFSADAEKRSLGVVVQFSFDLGISWHLLPSGGVRVLEDQAGIHLDAEDLMQVRRPGDEGDGMSLWEAMLNNAVRVRVTAVIEGDARLEPNVDAIQWGLPKDTTAQAFDVSGKFKSNRRNNANSIFGTDGGEKESSYQTLQCRDDLDEIQAKAKNILELCSSRQQPAALIVPWLTTDVAVGDCVEGVDGYGIRFYSHATEAQRRWPDVVAVHYTEATTAIVLEDRRILEEITRGRRRDEVVQA